LTFHIKGQFVDKIRGNAVVIFIGFCDFPMSENDANRDALFAAKFL